MMGDYVARQFSAPDSYPGAVSCVTLGKQLQLSDPWFDL